MTGRLRNARKGLVALGGLVLLVVGPPWALARFVGWPLPTTLPGLEEIRTATRGGVDDMVVVKVLAVLAWLCWAQIALAALVEAAALVRGRATRRVPVLPGVQAGVGRLVATAALVVASWGPLRPVATLLPVGHLAALVAEPLPTDRTPALASLVSPRLVAEVGSGAPAAAGPSYVVVRNDSWWAVAERMLGDGQRWHELREANLGRTMPDGSVIDSFSEMMRPGWELLVPGGGIEPTVSNGHVVEVEVEPGDNLWVMAERHLRGSSGGAVDEAEIRRHWQKVIGLNRDRFADPANPSRIYTGQRMRMPLLGGAPVDSPQAPGQGPGDDPGSPQSVPQPAPLPARPDSSLPEATTTTTSTEPKLQQGLGPAPAPTTSPSGPSPTSAIADAVPTDRKAVNPAVLLGPTSAVLAVGLAAALNRRRRRRLLHLPARAVAPNPPLEFDDLRAALVVNADVDAVTRLHRALRDIAAALDDRRSEARPRVVQVTGTRIEALLSHAVEPAPKPWRSAASGFSWELKAEPLDHDDDGIAPNPALVSIGRPDERSTIYLDLEAEGVVSLTGPAEAVGDVARSWVLELATSPMATGVSVLVLGDSLAPATQTSDRVRLITSWADAETDALTWCEQSAALLKANEWPTPATGRHRSEQADDLAPLVIFAQGISAKRMRRLAEAILDQQASVVLVAVGAEIEGALRLEAGDGVLAIPSLGLSCEAQAIPVEVAVAVDELLEEAETLPTQLRLLPAPPVNPAPAPPRPAAPSAPVSSSANEYCDPPFEILVRLLGDISVVGTSPPLKPKQVVVLTYVALYAPVAAERVQDAIWVTPTASRRRRLANTVSETRAVVGAANLPLSVDGRYRVGPGVVTDLDLFDRRLDYASQQDDMDAAATLRGALELVDGPVFVYRNAERMSYVWVDIDNWMSTWELKITDTAEELAQRYLDLGDPGGAVWSALRGLKTCQTHARLTRLLIEAHTAGGDTLAAERVRRSHQAVLERLELDDGPEDLSDVVARIPRGPLRAATLAGDEH